MSYTVLTLSDQPRESAATSDATKTEEMISVSDLQKRIQNSTSHVWAAIDGNLGKVKKSLLSKHETLQFQLEKRLYRIEKLRKKSSDPWSKQRRKQRVALRQHSKYS